MFFGHISVAKKDISMIFSFLGLNDMLLLFSDDICIILPVLFLKVGM